MWINVNMVSYEIILVKVCTSGKRSFQVARFHFSMSGMKILWGVRHGDEGWPVPNEASCFGLEGHVPLLLKLPRCCDFTWLSPQRQISQTSGILCDMIYTVFVIRILLIYSKIIKYICIMESSSNLGIGTNRYLAYRYLQSDSIGVHLFICGETMVQQRNRVLSFPNHPHRCGFTTNVSVDSWSYSFSRLQKWGSLSSVCVWQSQNKKQNWFRYVEQNFRKSSHNLEGSSPSAEVQHIYSKALLGDWKISGLVNSTSIFNLSFSN